MAINRRQFIQASVGTTLCTALPGLQAAETDPTLLIGASRLDTDHYAVSAISTDGRLHWQLPLPDRGHDVVVHPDNGLGVAIARRPGHYLVLFDVSTGQLLQQLAVDPAIHLNGHAAWIGNRLVVSASDAHNSQTRLQIYTLNERQLARTGERPFDYLGPHEIVFKQGQLVLAIGGLKTEGRTVLNRDTIQSGVLVLNPNTLAIEAAYWPDTHFVSWRHLTVDNTGQILVAGQNQALDEPSEPLLLSIRNNTMTPFQVPNLLWDRLQGYIGSIHACGARILASSPRAHWLGVFDRSSLSMTTQVLQHDLCALTSIEQQAFAASGTGQLWRDTEPSIQTRIIWDNHLTVG
ncbi:DUF1513 domain-containing protein [Reinekea blandensis]|uniref:Twin-arginine translocation pathway signal n=1 Tax=Reinekea blandensis MED297 TaxID=314283 RepID=A4BG15_9GAMM|nr:DUF1513 domain-containing protein [Reinekea blandensis]EAR09033.1 hypothetical protein MED297_04052 [Reinekea sp. MED297] [Reinekea blandensis MED297]